MDFEDPITNPKPAVVKKPGGTFQSMGLSRVVLKAVERKGYKLATPIQRKCIPPIMTGRDLVAMARTGSGKSAAFLLPLVDKLKIRQPKADIRALVLSPTRELATQTFKFVKEFTKFTNLISKIVIGGESINKDFETVTSCPDILVATPGRLAHVLVEMKQKLNGVEIVVFDEADRLFEPGFKEIEQVNEICQRLPDSKQTLLFSATMPQRLAEFAKLGLKNPLFIRLDVETNLSDTLKSIHLHCNSHDKFAILVHLLKNLVGREQMTVVFMPTKHHIEYTKMLLDNAQIDCRLVYSSMDPEARKINIDKFRKKDCRVMLVTDIAARGIDIPLLDVVINFNFPFKPKLFVHRVGRVARAGRFGCAISLISHDETPYLHALHMFLGSSITTASQVKPNTNQSLDLDSLPDNILGTVPQNVLDGENEVLNRWHEHNEELVAMVKVCDNAMKPYLKSREAPEPFSVKVAKDIHKKVIGVHPLFAVSYEENTEDQVDLLDRIKGYKPQTTIFEAKHIKGTRNTEAYEVMQQKRQYQDKFFIKYQPDNYAKEKGLGSFNDDLKRATFDLAADDEHNMKKQIAWDRKSKKYVTTGERSDKKIKTESGSFISASYQSGLYEKWKSQSKYDQRKDDHDTETSVDQLRARLKPTKRRRELKNPEEILKQRGIKEKREAILRIKTQRKAQRNAQKTSKSLPSKKQPRKNQKAGRKGPSLARKAGGKKFRSD